MRPENPTLQLNARVRSLMIGFLACLGIISVRLYYLQVIAYATLTEKSVRNYTRLKKINSLRGNIVDTHGVLLATNRPVITLLWEGSGKYPLTPTMHKTALLLGELLYPNNPEEQKKLYLTIERTEKYRLTKSLTEDIDSTLMSVIAEQCALCPSVTFSSAVSRCYPFKKSACHIIGYLGYAHMNNMMGLEKIMHEALQGSEGELIETINSLGSRLSTYEKKSALQGRDIMTTLDHTIQEILDTVFPRQFHGTAIVLDPNNGAIRGLISLPDFDPELFLRPLSPEDWKTVQNSGHPFLNRALSACYPPASIFKLVTLSAALEQNIITTQSLISCHGYITFCGREYGCVKRDGGHGLLTVKEAVAKSCNILFFHIAKHLDIDTLARYAHLFGLGEKTGIIFSEKMGIIPTRAWKRATRHEPWWQGETLSASIGQSYLLVTPLQVARMIGAIGTGFLVTPRILEDDPITKTPLKLNPDTLNFVRESMRLVTSTGGTGTRTGRIRDIEVWAKTGTAQVSALEKAAHGDQFGEHAWFVANFKYKDHPLLTIVVMVEHARSSAVATQMAREFLLQYRHRAREHPSSPHV